MNRDGGLLRLLGFAAAGASGVLPNLAVTWLLVEVAGVHYLVAAVAATQAAIAWNFALVDLLVFRRRRGRRLAARLGRFLLVNNADLALRLPALAVLVGWCGVDELVATAVTIAVAFLARFLVVDRIVYVPPAIEAA
ncbi:hypothetical protein Val02_19290 [Virgisporangium aliadipatigenens]|uniref:GtrA/DPMS transmembrane domain-containing protein n=1 Tax=Virgisporangium aliadipatigenens TaxID=741659 RepID=A0A8J4DPV0_9ACTN|nr:GtrA family protein [Virgisporangium aliadipatigenens]GIJ45043.1 hypothetical protein Val02_19290 [Virgisporangium aliadipatigenens]